MSWKPEPRAGCQEISTGALGGALMVSLVLAYGFFMQTVLPDGGPRVLDPFPWMPETLQFDRVSRDFFDLAAILAVGALWMATWELWRPYRPVTLLFGLVTAGAAWLAGLGAPWPYEEPCPGILSRFEALLALGMVALAMPWLSMALLALRAPPTPRAPLQRVLATSFWRWAAGLAAFCPVLILTGTHPYYAGEYFLSWRLAIDLLFSAYLVLGLPYAALTNLRRASLRDNTRDPGFVLALLGRAAIGGEWRCLRRALANRRTGTALRDLLVKLFFVPLMVCFFYANCGSLFSSLRALRESVSFDSVYSLLYWCIFALDVSLGLVGYLCAARWLGNKSVSVEPTLFGWAVALACYPPFNAVTGDYLPYGASMGTPWLMTGNPALDRGADIACKLAVLVLMGIYAWATTAFGLRFSNLTNRGILSGGPYRYVRHPAYISKNLAWWFESARNFGSPWQLVFLAGWNLIYALRALTEERHLMKDPDYRAYCRMVKHRFIPGVF